jgi:hypothetical protein
VEYNVAEAGEAEETVRVIATAFSTAEPLAVARVGSDRVICNATHERALLSPTGSRLWFEDHLRTAFFIVANHSELSCILRAVPLLSNGNRPSPRAYCR